jgi:hypothetical protein
MAPSKEVVNLVDSDEEESNKAKEKIDDDVVLIKIVQPPNGSINTTTTRTRGEKRAQVNNPYVRCAFKPQLKRPRTLLTEETASAGYSSKVSTVLVKLDKDGSDYGTTVPGCLQPEHEWITSNDTSKIVQFVGQKDDWSCGYRNLQMLLSALLPHLPEDHIFHTKYPRRSDQFTIPSLNQIQSVIESAWRDGFDPDGAAHFRHNLRGKRCFIGAVEVYSVLTFWGIDATIIQFIRCPESREELPRFIKSYFSKSLGRQACPFCSAKGDFSTTCSATEFANRLLTSASNDKGHPGNRKCQCPPMPLYFQWEGHSVTIVGVDDATDEFLVFNPQQKQGPTRLRISPLVARDTQILMVTSFRSISVSEQGLKKTIREFPTANLPAVMKTIEVQERRR